MAAFPASDPTSRPARLQRSNPTAISLILHLTTPPHAPQLHTLPKSYNSPSNHHPSREAQNPLWTAGAKLPLCRRRRPHHKVASLMSHAHPESLSGCRILCEAKGARRDFNPKTPSRPHASPILDTPRKNLHRRSRPRAQRLRLRSVAAATHRLANPSLISHRSRA
jgi:hypothetical protein